MINEIKASDNPPTKEETEWYSRLHKMTAENKLDSVKQLLEGQKIDLSKFDNEHFNPIIHVAVWSRNKDMVQYLLDKGANPRAKTSDNETALHQAALNGDLEIVKLLVQKGADLNIVYTANGGLSPLSCAAESGNMEMVKYLIDKGADVHYMNKNNGASPLRSAAYSAHYDIFLLLAQKQHADYDWQNALFFGLIGGNLDIVKYVVEEKGANVNMQSTIWKEYPIERACDNRSISNKNAQPLEVVKYLMSKGASLNNINNGNVFEWAMQNSTEATMEYMIERGVKVVVPPTEDGWTPLALALDNSNFALAKYLLKETKDHTFRDMPLVIFFADGMYNSPPIIDLLIQKGINKEHYTRAFGQCVLNNDGASAQLLLDTGVDIKLLNSDSSNILHYARSYDMAHFLIANGADVNNEVMLKNAWKNWTLLQALAEVNVVPPISQDQMNKALVNAAQLGNEWLLEYMLKRGAEADFFEPIPTPEPEKEEPRDNSHLTEEEKEREQEMYDKDVPVYEQTALIKNTIQGYAHCDYGNSNDENSKVQISPRIAELLLRAGANPNHADSKGKMALHYAAGSQWCQVDIWPIPMGTRRQRQQGFHGDPATPPLQHHDSIATVLIQNGANINAQDQHGNTPLILSAINRNHTILKMLLDAKADISIKNKRNQDLFTFLDDKASFQVIKDAGLWEKIPKERLNAAFAKFFTDYHRGGDYNVEELKTLISYGADVNTPLYANSTDNALAYTFNNMYGNNKWEIAQTLIDAGSDLYAEDRWGETLLMTLIKDNKEGESYGEDKSPTNLLFLIKNKINLNHKSSTQFTALGIAICQNKEDIVNLLLEHGAKRDLQSEWWFLIKDQYYNSNITDRLQQLIAQGIDINSQTPISITEYIPMVNQKGVTALMLFVAYGREKAVKALLEMGADVNIQAADGTTALSIARDRREKGIEDMLLKANAKE